MKKSYLKRVMLVVLPLLFFCIFLPKVDAALPNFYTKTQVYKDLKGNIIKLELRNFEYHITSDKYSFDTYLIKDGKETKYENFATNIFGDKMTNDPDNLKMPTGFDLKPLEGGGFSIETICPGMCQYDDYFELPTEKKGFQPFYCKYYNVKGSVTNIMNIAIGSYGKPTVTVDKDQWPVSLKKSTNNFDAFKPVFYNNRSCPPFIYATGSIADKWKGTNFTSFNFSNKPDTYFEGKGSQYFIFSLTDPSKADKEVVDQTKKKIDQIVSSTYSDTITKLLKCLGKNLPIPYDSIPPTETYTCNGGNIKKDCLTADQLAKMTGMIDAAKKKMMSSIKVDGMTLEEISFLGKGTTFATYKQIIEYVGKAQSTLNLQYKYFESLLECYLKTSTELSKEEKEKIEQALSESRNEMANFDRDLGDKLYYYDFDFDLGIEQEITCDSIISPELQELIKNIYQLILLLAVIILIALGILDFVKATASGEQDNMKKAIKSFGFRLMATILLFLIPLILTFLLGLIGISNPFCNAL